MFITLLAVFGGGCLLGFVVFLYAFGRNIWNYLLDMGYIDWPAWVYRLRRWWRGSGKQTMQDLLLIISIMGLCWLGFLITEP
ncbi:hypothetical protein [Spirosoma sp. KNUC1025]|uniref:hypothetical protein n=1 Tax=Spirosoma sp. KNUC1025 TaxID=2894082 RepID=UPI0038699A95|nr:hypothetical protein LN737_19060 [Spirosoma sp. KNUC1025]